MNCKRKAKKDAYKFSEIGNHIIYITLTDCLISLWKLNAELISEFFEWFVLVAKSLTNWKALFAVVNTSLTPMLFSLIWVVEFIIVDAELRSSCECNSEWPEDVVDVGILCESLDMFISSTSLFKLFICFNEWEEVWDKLSCVCKFCWFLLVEDCLSADGENESELK